jgi:hypothetical protein
MRIREVSAPRWRKVPNPPNSPKWPHRSHLLRAVRAHIGPTAALDKSL